MDSDAESNVDFLSLGGIREGGQRSAGKKQENRHSNCVFQLDPPRKRIVIWPLIGCMPNGRRSCLKEHLQEFTE